jgi:hypothetical protein
MIGRERDGVRQQGFGSLITGYIDSTSLAQPRVAAHQEYKSQVEDCSRFSREGLSRLRKTYSCSQPVFMALQMAFRRVFHGFLQQSRFALWIWLESEYILGHAGVFRTRSSDRWTACSQLVGASTLLSIAVCILSAASTGIDCYYCIYIDISIYNS